MMESCPTAKRIGIIGGSFDPLHLGHLIIAQDAAEHLGLSEVVFIPAATPPHKQHAKQVAAEHRLNMLKLAVDSDARFSVSDIEILRGGLSSTSLSKFVSGRASELGSHYVWICLLRKTKGHTRWIWPCGD